MVKHGGIMSIQYIVVLSAAIASCVAANTYLDSIMLTSLQHENGPKLYAELARAVSAPSGHPILIVGALLQRHKIEVSEKHIVLASVLILELLQENSIVSAAHCIEVICNHCRSSSNYWWKVGITAGALIAAGLFTAAALRVSRIASLFRWLYGGNRDRIDIRVHVEPEGVIASASGTLPTSIQQSERHCAHSSSRISLPMPMPCFHQTSAPLWPKATFPPSDATLECVLKTVCQTVQSAVAQPQRQDITVKEKSAPSLMRSVTGNSMGMGCGIEARERVLQGSNVSVDIAHAVVAGVAIEAVRVGVTSLMRSAQLEYQEAFLQRERRVLCRKYQESCLSAHMQLTKRRGRSVVYSYGLRLLESGADALGQYRLAEACQHLEQAYGVFVSDLTLAGPHADMQKQLGGIVAILAGIALLRKPNHE